MHYSPAIDLIVLFVSCRSTLLCTLGISVVKLWAVILQDDKLLPIGHLTTIHDLAASTAVPCSVYFYRRSAEVHINDVCSILHIPGVSEGL